METIIKSKSEFLPKDAIEDLYRQCQLWLSETKFSADELKFLQNIFDQYFYDIVAEHKQEELELMEKKLFRATHKTQKFQEKIMKQEEQVFEIIENAFSHDEQAFRDEHEKLKKELKEMNIEIHALKRKVFRFAEEAMVKSKLREKQPTM